VARKKASSTDDDAVPLKDEDLRVLLPIEHSLSARFGAAAGFVIRRIAYRAGSYAPGIQEFMFHELTTPPAGRSLDAVSRWLASHSADLHGMGYRISGRRLLGERTDAILGWIKEGKGFRGAVLATEYRRLHPAEGATEGAEHAIGVAIDRVAPTAPEDLVMVDPWPGTKNGARDRMAISPALEAAHRKHKYAALVFYWAGWS
jgi:hypothetical protein